MDYELPANRSAEGERVQANQCAELEDGRNTIRKKTDRLSTTVDSMSWPEIRAPTSCCSIMCPWEKVYPRVISSGDMSDNVGKLANANKLNKHTTENDVTTLQILKQNSKYVLFFV